MIQPWAKVFTFGNPQGFMTTIALFDITVGIWLLSGFMVWVAALLAVLHLFQVLIGAGITHETYRDIGLLATSAALLLVTLPENILSMLGGIL